MDKERRMQETLGLVHRCIAKELNLPPAHKMLINMAYWSFCRYYAEIKAGSDDWRSFTQEVLRFVPDRLEEYGIVMPIRRQAAVRIGEAVENYTYRHIMGDGDTRTAIAFKKAFEDNLVRKLGDNQEPFLD